MLKKMLSQSTLKRHLEYNKETGDFVWLSPAKSRPNRAGTSACTSARKGYVSIFVCGKLYYAHRLAWLYEYGYLPENGVDHINRIKTDNRIENLREVSQKCNSINKSKQSNNKSGVTGVSWILACSKWTSQIKFNGKNINLGRFDNFIDAVIARYHAEKECDFYKCINDSSSYEYLETNLDKYRNRELHDLGFVGL